MPEPRPRAAPALHRVRRMPTPDVARLLARAEAAIERGDGGLADYETFVACERELARRVRS